MKRLLPVIAIALLLAGCSSLKFWDEDDGGKARAEPEAARDEAAAEDDAGEPRRAEDDGEDEDEDELPDLPDIEATVTLDREWSIGLGGEQEPFDAMLRPALADGMV